MGSIKSNLPQNGPVLAIAEDHVNPNLLFTGTEFGLFFSIDGGQKWIQLKGGMPTISVRDLAIQKRENDLVVATFGRGIYILDNYTPLRLLKPEMLNQEAAVFPVKDAMMYIQSQPLGGRGKHFQGERFSPRTIRRLARRLLTILKESPKTRKEKRQEAEKEAERRGTPLPYPALADLSAEEEEEAPAIIVTISDATGRVVRRLNAPLSPGINRVSWDLRYPAPTLAPPRPADGEDDPFAEPPGGPLVMPGKYSVTLAKRVNGVISRLSTPQEFTVYRRRPGRDVGARSRGARGISAKGCAIAASGVRNGGNREPVENPVGPDQARATRDSVR